MTTFSASYPEIAPPELVRYLLYSAGQYDRDCVNPRELLNFLKLDHISFSFAAELPDEAQRSLMGAAPRALLSFDDRLIATDESLDENRARFSVLHEIGHYVLPRHEHALYLCDDLGLTYATRLVMEREANKFAADLLFLGDRFSVEANARPISAATVKELATRYRASFEATARRLVEKNFRPSMLICFKRENQREIIDVDVAASWVVHYCVASAAFKTTYFEKVTGRAPAEAVAAVTRPGRDIADGYVCEIAVPGRAGSGPRNFRAEFFSNTYNIFCLLTLEK